MLQLRRLLYDTRFLKFDDLDSVEIWAKPLLCSAVGNGWIYGAMSLLRRGANPNIESRAGQTPLMLAVDGDDIRMTRLLLQHGADVNLAALPIFPDQFDVATPLQTAVFAKHHDIVEVLLEYGADINDDLFDESALSMAIRARNLKTAKLLLHAGASHPKDAVWLAVENGDLEMVSLLYEEGFCWPDWREALDDVEMPCDAYVCRQIKNMVSLNELLRDCCIKGKMEYIDAFLCMGFMLQVAQIAPYLSLDNVQKIRSWADQERSFYAAFYHGEDSEEEDGIRRLTDAPGPISDYLAHFLLPPLTSRQFLRESRYW